MPNFIRFLDFSGYLKNNPTRRESESQHKILTQTHKGKPYFKIPAKPNPLRKTTRLAIPDHIKNFFLFPPVGAAAAAAQVPKSKMTNKTWTM